MTATITRPNWKKMLLQMLAGAVIGGAATMAALMTWDDLDPSDPAQMVAFVTGMIYALMGTMVGIGAIAPAAGARMLNVEDVEDLRDQRTILGLSAAACLFIGLLFLTLAAVPAGGNSGPFSREVAAVLAGVCLVALILLTLLTNRRVDELTLHISMEASSLAMQSSFVIFGGWAALAHLGFVEWIGPLALISGLALLQLLAIFWVSGKRGLMVSPKAG